MLFVLCVCTAGILVKCPLWLWHLCKWNTSFLKRQSMNIKFYKKQSSLSRQLQYFFFFFFFIEFEYFSNFVKFCTMKLCDYIKIKMSLIKRLKPRARVCLVCYFTWRQKRNSPKFSFFISRYSCWQASACDGAIFGCGAILDFHAQLPVGEMVNIPGFNPSPQWLAGII